MNRPNEIKPTWSRCAAIDSLQRTSSEFTPSASGSIIARLASGTFLIGLKETSCHAHGGKIPCCPAKKMNY